MTDREAIPLVEAEAAEASRAPEAEVERLREMAREASNRGTTP